MNARPGRHTCSLVLPLGGPLHVLLFLKCSSLLPSHQHLLFLQFRTQGSSALLGGLSGLSTVQSAILYSTREGPVTEHLLQFHFILTCVITA